MHIGAYVWSTVLIGLTGLSLVGPVEGASTIVDDFSVGPQLVTSMGTGMAVSSAAATGGRFESRVVSLDIATNLSAEEVIAEVDPGFSLFFLEIPAGVEATGSLQYSTADLLGVDLTGGDADGLGFDVDFVNVPMTVDVEVVDIFGAAAEGSLGIPAVMAGSESFALPYSSFSNGDATDFSRVAEMSVTYSFSMVSADFSLQSVHLVPEPSNAALLGLSGILGLLHRKRNL